ncbi:hypothetical protein GP486_006220 [Trichoglossum hirsutum]|uniref:Uncharacterized protein n=1 Tax=Trichoglossum hirsutum TaxID=265104 RepID=A0A9P8IDY8_9PEZI|nr:hypothetical protein GP486_006220 [Trichoglossum hirsutum]
MKLLTPLSRSLASDARIVYRARTIVPISRCLLHTTNPAPATPLPVTAHGPPPKPPIPTTTLREDRIARRQRQAEQAKQRQQEPHGVRDQKDSGGLRKRFWKDVKVHETPGYV